MNFFSIHQFVRYMTLGVVLSVLGIASAHASDLSDALKKSDYVLLMRHALAPGVGDPSGYSLQDCKTQRNLSHVLSCISDGCRLFFNVICSH